MDDQKNKSVVVSPTLDSKKDKMKQRQQQIKKKTKNIINDICKSPEKYPSPSAIIVADDKINHPPGPRPGSISRQRNSNIELEEEDLDEDNDDVLNVFIDLS